VQLGTRTNQQFVQIPHARFIDQLTYKANLVGIPLSLTHFNQPSKKHLCIKKRSLLP
jgi:putative transposase